MLHTPHSFGALLKEARKALDLTQGELGALTGCSPRTIAKIESGERRPSRQLADLLARALEIPEEEREEFIRLARRITGAHGSAVEKEPTRMRAAPERRADRTPSRPHNNLPASPTEFIGREQQIVEAAAMLRRPYVRLVTLTGPGGVGKSRLSVEIADEVLDDFPDGVFFVALAAIDDHSLVMPVIARTLGVEEAAGRPVLEELKEQLRDRRVLLVLDNFEQVLPAAVPVADLLAACPHLKVLVTSREILHLRGEREMAVPPMSLPAQIEQEWGAEGLMEAEATRLFVERVRDRNPGYVPTDHDARAIVEICARLDGLPLAIELVAARAGFLPPGALLRPLEQTLEAATGPLYDLPTRQRTLRDTIGWSYALLDEKEQRLFRRLAVFAGSAPLDAIHAMSGTAGSPLLDTLRCLESLADKSLLRYAEVTGPEGEPRFSIYSTIREYMWEKLKQCGEDQEMSRRHVRYYMEEVEKALPQLRGPGQARWLGALEQEHDNLRAALQWAREQAVRGAEAGEAAEAAGIGLCLAGALWYFWSVRGYYSEGRDHLSSALQTAQALGIESDCTARALRGAGELAMQQGETATARSLQKQSLAAARRAGNREDVAAALGQLGRIAWHQGDNTAARGYYEESLSLAREVGDKQGIAAALGNLGVAAVREGDHAAARAYYEESLKIKREAGDKRFVARLLMNLGNVAVTQRDNTAARGYYEESLSLTREVGDKLGTAMVLSNLGALDWHEMRYASARLLLEESLALSHEIGEHLSSATSLCTLGNIVFSQGDSAEARAKYKESLALSREIGAKHEISTGLVGLAQVEAAAAGEGAGMLRQEHARNAARLLGAVESIQQQLGTILDRDTAALYERTLALSRSLLEDAEFEQARLLGRNMSVEQATAFALGLE